MSGVHSLWSQGRIDVAMKIGVGLAPLLIGQVVPGKQADPVFRQLRADFFPEAARLISCIGSRICASRSRFCFICESARPRCLALRWISPTRFIKNSSRLDVKMPRNISRSSNGLRLSSDFMQHATVKFQPTVVPVQVLRVVSTVVSRLLVIVHGKPDRRRYPEKMGAAAHARHTCQLNHTSHCHCVSSGLTATGRTIRIVLGHLAARYRSHSARGGKCDRAEIAVAHLLLLTFAVGRIVPTKCMCAAAGKWCASLHALFAFLAAFAARRCRAGSWYTSCIASIGGPDGRGRSVSVSFDKKRERVMNIADFLKQEKVKFDVISHMDTYNAQTMAQTLHVSGHHVAKTVLLRADGGKAFVVAVLPASRSIDLQLVSQLLGGRQVELASEADMADHCPDCELGALPPFGSYYGMMTIVDAGLDDDEEILFEGNNHHESIRMLLHDFRQIEQPVVGHFTKLQF